MILFFNEQAVTQLLSTIMPADDVTDGMSSGEESIAVARSPIAEGGLTNCPLAGEEFS